MGILKNTPHLLAVRCEQYAERLHCINVPACVLDTHVVTLCVVQYAGKVYFDEHTSPVRTRGCERILTLSLCCLRL